MLNKELITEIATWAEGRDPNESYNFWSGTDCAAARFMRATGRWTADGNEHCNLGRELAENQVGFYSRIFAGTTENPHRTMGDVAKRARELLAA